MGRCIYGGIYDPESPLSDSNGYRLDVLSALKELNIPVMRYPGGNFVATYHWLDGVGPRDQRPVRPELAWLGTETNQFGTDEFMHWLSVLGEDVEPYIALNFGTGTLDEALGWLEYCNGTKNTYYANLRRKNGREEPYNVKYWALGNEVCLCLLTSIYSFPTIVLIMSRCGETGKSASKPRRTMLRGQRNGAKP